MRARRRPTSAAGCCSGAAARSSRRCARGTSRTIRRRRFLIDPEDHIDARRDGRARGLDVVGFYHSHPRSAAEPSARDLAEFGYPDHLYLIVSLQREPPEIALFALDDGRFRRLLG